MVLPEEPGLGIDTNKDYLAFLKYETSPKNDWKTRNESSFFAQRVTESGINESTNLI